MYTVETSYEDKELLNKRRIIFDDGSSYVADVTDPYGLWKVTPENGSPNSTIFDQMFTSIDEVLKAMTLFDGERKNTVQQSKSKK